MYAPVLCFHHLLFSYIYIIYNQTKNQTKNQRNRPRSTKPARKGEDDNVNISYVEGSLTSHKPYSYIVFKASFCLLFSYVYYIAILYYARKGFHKDRRKKKSNMYYYRVRGAETRTAVAVVGSLITKIHRHKSHHQSTPPPPHRVHYRPPPRQSRCMYVICMILPLL
jgi:hypothetical protein